MIFRLLQNLDDATHYDLYIENVLIGEKCLLDESVRSLSILFTKPEAMEVKFYSSETAEEPLTTAWCHESGILVFPGTEYPPAGETVEEAEGGENSSAGEAGANHNEQSGSGEPGSAENPVKRVKSRITTTRPVAQTINLPPVIRETQTRHQAETGSLSLTSPEYLTLK